MTSVACKHKLQNLKKKKKKLAKLKMDLNVHKSIPTVTIHYYRYKPHTVF